MYSEAAVLNVRQYLLRIGLEEPVCPDLHGLNDLIRAHLTHIPFEALDVWGAGMCPSLEISDLYEKIILNNRGGYCFELNTLFCALLTALGFDAYQVIASLLDEEGQPAPPAHTAIICVIDGIKYFVDVGFGGPVPFGAMELTDSDQYGFRLVKKDAFYILKKIDAQKEKYLIRFREIPVDTVELIPLNFYISQKPDIHFRHTLLVNQRKADGSVCTLTGNELRVHSGEYVEVYPVNDLQTLRDVLRDCFQIDPDKAALRDSKSS